MIVAGSTPPTGAVALTIAELRIVMRGELEAELIELREARSHFQKLATVPRPMALDARVDDSPAGTDFGRFKGDE